MEIICRLPLEANQSDASSEFSARLPYVVREDKVDSYDLECVKRSDEAISPPVQVLVPLSFALRESRVVNLAKKEEAATKPKPPKAKAAEKGFLAGVGSCVQTLGGLVLGYQPAADSEDSAENADAVD